MRAPRAKRFDGERRREGVESVSFGEEAAETRHEMTIRVGGWKIWSSSARHIFHVGVDVDKAPSRSPAFPRRPRSPDTARAPT
jgi:hypothetical protein